MPRTIGCLVLLWLLTLCGLGPVRANEKRPNILFLFADDQCYETVRALGHDDRIETPNLDRLARRGTTFDRCYNMGSWSGAVCVASRTMLNTGRFVWRAQKIYNTSEQERQAGRWWSEYLKQAGYRTYLTGKWHCKANETRAFDVVRHVRAGMPKDTREGYDRPRDDRPDPWSPSDPRFGGYWEGGRHWSEVVADDAIDYLREAAQRTEPYFMYVAFNAPHDPRQSPQSYLDRYPVESMAVPANFLPEYPFKDDIGCSAELRDERLAPFPRTEHAVQVHRREYYSLVTHLDAQIGRILDELDRTPGGESTWIFFTADHGLAVGQHGLLGKQNMYEHSLRVPFLVAGPGVAADRRIASPIYLQDVMPTTLALAGVERPTHVEFQDLLPILRGDRESRYESIYGGYLQLQRMVIRDGWKLIVYPQARTVRLYHVADDPHEVRDLAGDAEQQPQVRKLFAELQRLQIELDDPLDLSKTFPQWQ